MNKSELKAVIHSSFRRLKKSYDQLTGSKSFDPIHDFRVEIKKLRALLDLLSIHQVHKIKIQKDLKEIYRKSGVIRELQLVIESRKEKGMTWFFDGCEESLQMKKAKDQLAGCMRHQVLNKAEKEIIESLPGKLTSFDIQRYFRKKILKVQKLLSLRFLTDEQLHLARKLLKDLLYNAQILENELMYQFDDITWNKNREFYFSAITADLGKYHDLVVNAQRNGITSSPRLHVEGLADPKKDQPKKNLVNSLRKNLFSRYPLAPLFGQH